MKQYERVCADINLDAIQENVETFRQRLDGSTKIMAVIKSDGYGIGAFPIARMLEEKDYIFGFATATAEEALILRRSGISKKILILGYTFPYAYEDLIREEISITVFRRDTLPEIEEAAKKVHKKALIHIKVDTGMSRIGIMPNEQGEEFVKETFLYPHIVTEGIFTHLATADEEDDSKAEQQVQVFHRFVDKTEADMGVRIPFHHCENSAGIVAFPNGNMDIVRLGISLYGIMPSDEMNQRGIKIKSVLTLRSKIVYIKEVPMNTAISYGGTYVTKKTSIIATIPVGYGDGFPRSLSNIGYVLIKGQKAPIRGRICMDQFMVDITDIPGVEEGDTAILIGKDGEEEITVETLCNLYGGFRYEMICNLGKRVPKIYYTKQQPVYYKDYHEDLG